MNLETSAGQKLANPSASQIAEQLATLPAGVGSFAILLRDELTYIETAGAPSEGFILEYQDGSIEEHYRSTEENLPLSTVTNVFQLYAVGDPSWPSLATWEHDDLRRGFPLLPVALIAAVVLGLVLWWWRAAQRGCR